MNNGCAISHVRLRFSCLSLVVIFYRSGPYTEATAEYIRHGGPYALATAVLDSIVLVFAIVIAFLLRSVEI